MQKVTKDKIKEILSKRVKHLDSLNIPHFSSLFSERPVKRVIKAIENKERIVIVGDYDVDGVSSAALMKRFFREIGVEVRVVIPNRFSDGYGFSLSVLERIDGDLIITVDNGIASFEAVNEAKKRGIDVIVTDHHTPFEKLPDAYYIINPKVSSFPYKEICGAEVAWYFCAGIKSELGVKVDMRDFLDIVAIAIVADIMPLVYLNRTLFNIGIKKLNQAKKAFSKVLREYFKKELKAEDIAYQVAPRLNSAGRLGSADIAYEFLVTDDLQRARELFLKLDELNNKRKEIEKEVLESVEVGDEGVILVSGDFNEGVIGIIASKLVSKYSRPAIVFSKSKGILKGSGRSLGRVDLFELIKPSEDILESFGGHKMACGLSLKEENFERFKEEINKRIKQYKKEDFFKRDFVLGELDFSEIDKELLEIIETFEPYGEGNEKPKFIAKAEVRSISHLKDNHYKLFLSNNNKILPALVFGYDGEFGSEIEFKFSLSKDRYENIQLLIEEIL